MSLILETDTTPFGHLIKRSYPTTVYTDSILRVKRPNTSRRTHYTQPSGFTNVPTATMCVTNIYRDVYPDGRTSEFRQTSICQYGLPGRPCAKLSKLENPIRKIQWGEPTTEYMLTQGQRAFPQTPPRSSGGSHHRYSGGDSGSEGGRRRHFRHRSPPPLRATRQHRKERIVIVDSPPTPRTPPQVFNQVFTAPNSPTTRGRPIIVDERPLHNPPPRVPSVGAVVGDRPPRRTRSTSRPRYGWDSPSSSHTSFDLRLHLEEEEREREAERSRRAEEDARIAKFEADRLLAERIAAQDEEIRRRPVVPPAPSRQRQYLRPVVDQSLSEQMGGLNLAERVGERASAQEAEVRRRMEERDRAMRARIEAEMEEAMRQRLRERQLPRRRFSVGPALRRHRVLYDDGLYRWE